MKCLKTSISHTLRQRLNHCVTYAQISYSIKFVIFYLVSLPVGATIAIHSHTKFQPNPTYNFVLIANGNRRFRGF